MTPVRRRRSFTTFVWVESSISYFPGKERRIMSKALREVALRVEDVSKTFWIRSEHFPYLRKQEKKALNNVSFELEVGKTLVLFGANGSGKSTLIRSILGLLLVDQGNISLFGNSRVPNHRHQVAWAPAEACMADGMTVRENISFFARLYHLPVREVCDSAFTLLDDLGFPVKYFSSKTPRYFSSGEQQMIRLATAYSLQRDLIVLDEPTSALDVARQLKVSELINKQRKSRKVTTIVATHDPHFATNVGSVFLVLKNGEVTALGDQQTLFDVAGINHGSGSDRARSMRAALQVFCN